MFSLALAGSASAADPLDNVPLDLRARLAVAACAFPPSEAPMLDPDNPQFKPEAAANYLETNEDGHYAVSITRDGVEIWYTLLRFPDAKEAAAGLASWQASGDPTTPLDWGGSFPASWRGQGLLGIGMLGAGIVARGQSGRWHFEISARDTGLFAENAQSREIAAAIEAMRTLAANAKRYRIFPRELVVEYVVADRTRRLAPGEPFQVPLQADVETHASFRLQVTDQGRPVENASYKARLSGALAPLAELDLNGSRGRGTLAEVQSPSGEPVTVTWIFPPANTTALAPIIDGGDTSLSVMIEARTAPTVLP